jgi:hypothetical protein
MLTVCLVPTRTLVYPKGGGHFWIFLNWALGLRAIGCRVIWLEVIWPDRARQMRANFPMVRRQLGDFQLDDCVAVTWPNGDPVLGEEFGGCLDLEAACQSDLLLNLQYAVPAELLRRFRRTALVDIDPGLLQVWHAKGVVSFAPHDLYFSIGETVGRPDAAFPDCGIRWHYMPPPVFLPEWPVVSAASDAPYTTVAHWWLGKMEWDGVTFSNDKRTSFLDVLDLPTESPAKLELALCLGEDETEEGELWKRHGWSVRHSWDVTASAAAYRAYIRASRGEFSCAKPSCMRLQNAWISDRTLCYLASGKPAIVQHTGPSRALPDAAGLFRFHTPQEAAAALATVEADYDRHCALARGLAEEYFDSTKVMKSVLERALT